MTYIPGFKKDVFISFCHVDNDKSRGGNGWVADFEQHLLTTLRKKLTGGKQVEVWRDVKMAGNDVISDEIEANLRGSAVLVSLVSPNYLSSTGKMGCLEELEMFWTNQTQGLEVRVDDKLRIFKVILQDVPLDEHPTKIRGIRGYSFFDKQPPQDGWTCEYFPKSNDNPDGRYWRRLEELVSEIAAMLTLLRSKVPAPVSGTQPPPGVVKNTKPEGTVYLAETANDLENNYYWVRGELERKNLRVLPVERLPSKRADAEPVIRAALAQSQMAVHLFSKQYGTRFGQGEWSVPHLQYQLAIEVAKTRYAVSSADKLPRIACIPVDMTLDSADAPQQELLKTIELEEIPDHPIDVQRLPHDQLQRLVDSIAAQLLEPVLPPPESGALIYVTGTPEDLSDGETKAMIEYMRRRKHDVFMPTALNDQAKRDKQDEANMKSSDGLVIVYGKADAAWVVEKALAVRECARGRRKKPLTATVLDGPPEEKDELNIDFENPKVLKSRTGFQPKVLHPFLQRVEGVQHSGGGDV